MTSLGGIPLYVDAWGADAIPAYLEDLDREIEGYRSAYVGAAVTEIASFRALLSGPQVG